MPAVAIAAGLSLWYVKSRPKPIPTSRSVIGQVETRAGTGAPGIQDGPAEASSFINPFGLAVDGRDNLIVSEGGAGNRIRRITRDGKLETIAGADEHQFDSPSGIAVDKSGNVLVADTANNRIRKIGRDGRVNTIAGNGEPGFNDGPAESARFDGPVGVAVDQAGNIIVADTYNDRIRRISIDGNVSTIAGCGAPGMSDGPAADSLFDTPCGVAIDGQGDILVADTGNNAIRRISPDGAVTTIAGGLRGQADGNGSEAGFDHPVGIVITHDGFLFVTDEGSGCIRRISPDGEVATIAGSRAGFENGSGGQARFNGPCGIAIDGKGTLYVADTQNYLIRRVSLVNPVESRSSNDAAILVQPPPQADSLAADQAIPRLDEYLSGVRSDLWPVEPRNKPHEITGVVGEARGAFGGIALDHLHRGLDIRGAMGEAALSVLSEKVSSPIPNWDFDGPGEGIQVGLASYIHVRIGRDKTNRILDEKKFKPRKDGDGAIIGVRVRRGTRFDAGDIIGTLNSLYHVHLNYGPWNAQANPIRFPPAEFKDTIPPVLEPNGIEVVAAGSNTPFKEKREGRLLISGDVAIIAAAHDQIDGNIRSRKLGVFRIGYQILGDDGAPAPGYERPLMNIEFSRLPPDDAVDLVYAPGSGVSAYGIPTKFKYVVTNRVRDGVARRGLLRTSLLAPGDYVIKIIAEDYAGNRAAGKSTELRIRVVKPPSS